MAKIIIEIGSCQDCPFCRKIWGEKLPEGLFLYDMYCNSAKRYIYMELFLEKILDIPPVPAWCPHKVVE